MNTIKALRKKHGLNQSQLAQRLNVTQATVSRWESGDILPDIEMVKSMAQMFNTSTDALLENSNQVSSRGVKIPVLGRVQAGIPIEAIEDILDYEEIEPELAETGEFFALQIKGDSMEPKFSEGDVVIVRRQPDIESGEIAVVLVNGDCATVKKIIKHANGISLVSSNAAYMPMFYTMQEIEDLPVEVLGKVIELRAKF